MFRLKVNKACTLLALAILILVASSSGITSTVKAATQDNNLTAHPFLHARPVGAPGPDPLIPTQIINAYRLALSTNGNGTTIAIVDAYDDPTIASDLAAFSSYFQLPDANFIKHKMATSISVDGGWAREISLDVEWAHAIAPQATILLVEAVSNSYPDLLAAVDYATSYPGVVAVSMSWGSNEFNIENIYDSHFIKPGIVFFASSGDNGSGATWPSSSPNVVSVGGTTLNLDSNGAVISETAWSGSGGGVSTYEQQPSYQANYGLTYAMRATPDVSFDADLNTGVNVYDTTPYQGYSGWWILGGTSFGAPAWAAIQALGQTTGNSNFYQDAKQSATSYFRDIISGSNGYLAAPGYDLVTGLGSPITTNFTPPSTAPSAPRSLTAVGRNGYVTLTWQAPSSNGGSSITGYKVYRSTTSGGETLLTTLGNVLTYTNTGLTNGQTYNYTVSAVNGVGEGAMSNEASATPATMPTAPTLTSVMPGNSQVVLTWTAPNSNGGSSITGYKVYRGTSSGGETLLATLGNVLTYTNTGLTNGQAYYYKISALNSVGEGPQSNEVSAMPATVPGIPQSLSTVSGNAQVILTWSSPAINGGSAITGYKVYRSTTETGTYSLIASPSGTIYTDTSLSNGQTYWYKVSAVNAVGEGVTTPSIPAIPYTVPDAPTGLTAIAMNSQITLNWTAPTFDGGRAIDYYVIYQDGVAIFNPSTGLTTTITGLTNGQNYFFTVVAHNAAGIGDQSINATAIPFTKPGAPQGLTITPSNAQVTLSWTAPSFNGGRVITNYSVYRGIASGEEILQVALGNVLTYTDTSLINGQTYFYKVSAVNLAGVGPQSDEVTAIPYTAPNVPTGLTAIADNGRVTLNWTAPAFNGGNAIDYYAIYKDGVALLDHPIGLAMVIGDLTNGLTYSFTIAAHNLAGNGTQSNATFSRPYTVPDVSTGLTAIAGDAQITLNWTSPPFDGGRAIDYYVIYQDGIALPDLRTDLTTTIPRVINGQNYSFTVAAHNLAGLGPQSIVASGMPFTTPNVPIGLHAIAGNTQVTLNWTAPGFNGGRAIDYYIVYQEGLDAAHSTTTMAIITNLNNGQGYNFTVMAHNVAGNSTQSNSVSTTPMTVPGAPTGVTATPGPNKVTITWQAPLTTGGSPIIWYTVYRDSIPFIDVNASTMEFVDPTGTVGTTYTYYVVATNAAGNGPGSLAISVASQADNTLLYIGIGAIAIIALAGVAFLVLRKRK